MRRCTARSKRSGERCKRAPIVAGTVCPSHGGLAPQVQASARQRLDALVVPAIATMNRAVRSNDLPTALNAAKTLLKSAGLHEPNRDDLIEVDAAMRIVHRFMIEVTAWVARECDATQVASFMSFLTTNARLLESEGIDVVMSSVVAPVALPPAATEDWVV